MRELLIDWADINAFVAELVPPIVSDTPGVSNEFPGMLWLQLVNVEIDGFDDRPDGDTQPGVQKALCVLTYATREFDQTTSSFTAPSGGNFPGSHVAGSGGPGGNIGGTPQTFFTHRVTMAGEFLTLPNDALQWNSDNGTLTGDVSASKIVPSVSHTLMFPFVLSPPWAAIRYCIGQVNEASFLGAPAECLLFLGAGAHRDVMTDGQRTWNVTFNFSEKLNYNESDNAPKGWNY